MLKNKKTKQKKLILFIILISIISCKTNAPIQKKPKITKEPEKKAEIKKDPFLGVYSMNLTKSLKGITSYSVEFKKDKTARVIIFKKNRKKPKIYHGKYLFSKKNKNIIVLYFPKNVPSEFLLRHNDGSLSILDENKKLYKGKKAKIFKLSKIK